MKKFYCYVMQVAVHLIFGIFVQWLLWSLIIWRYDFGIWEYAFAYGLIMCLLLADYYIVSMTRVSSSLWWLHLVDLLLVVPSAQIAIVQLFQGASRFGIFSVLLLDGIVIMERIVLIRKTWRDCKNANT